MTNAFSWLQLTALAYTLASLVAAFVLGAAIGFERQFRQRTAGLRTNTLVAVGAAIFVDMASRLNGSAGATQVVAYVVSGVGFLGAGVIMREEGNVRGINTAATLWGSAAVGACAGSHLFVEATLGAVFVLAANTLLRPVVDAVNRRPLDGRSAEVTYSVFVIAPRESQRAARERLESVLEAARYPIRELDLHLFGTADVQIEATLLSTSVEAEELDRLVAKLAQETFITQAFWSPSITE
ncbi:MAG TPA: MgtC/SapB family protein [Burkholderiaceae bacterium]|jgi:putative Mg2+ transporter-C (MgtC) family protein|nr:MgtC/SapB family protein [Burkholderiaceae bacterium]